MYRQVSRISIVERGRKNVGGRTNIWYESFYFVEWYKNSDFCLFEKHLFYKETNEEINFSLIVLSYIKQYHTIRLIFNT